MKGTITAEVNWREITAGGTIYECGNAENFSTGDWRTMRPVFLQDRCKQCLLCVPTCPDVAIPVKEGKRVDFKYDHCKGCGVCVRVCPFTAIDYVKEEK